MYAVKKISDKTYSGWRMVQADWPLEQDEVLLESLDGYSQETPPPPPLSINDKRLMLMEQFKSLPELTRRAFKQTALDVEGFLRLDDITNAIFFLEEAKLAPNADQALINGMINFLKS
jgi:hypothetical protein